MEDCRLPKGVLFGELDPVRPRHGPRKRWRDIIVDDLAHIKPPVAIAEWYGLAQDRKEWRAIADRPYALEPASLGSFPCSCGREFHRSGDLKRHENIAMFGEDKLSAITGFGRGHVQGSRCVCVCVYGEGPNSTIQHIITSTCW